MKIPVFLFCLFVISVQSFGQKDSVTLKSANLRAAFNGSIIYPGATISIDFPVQQIELTKFRQDSIFKKIYKSRFVSATLGYYHHYGFHDNIYLLPEFIMRRAKNKKWFSEFSAGLGFSRTYLGGTTYEVDQSGNVSIVPMAGFSYFVASAGFGLGYNLKNIQKIPLTIFSRFRLLMMFPYNSTLYPRPTIDIGLLYSPEVFFRRKVNILKWMKGGKS